MAKKIVVLVAMLSIATTAHAQSFNVDFGSAGAGTPVPPTFDGEVDPGPWNNITALGTTSNLLSADSAATAASVAVTADTAVGLFDVDDSDISRLREDNFFSTGVNLWQATFAGLDPGRYDVIVYAPTNPNVPTGSFTVNGVAVSSFQGSNTATLTEGTDWKRVAGVVVTGSGILAMVNTAKPGSLAGLAGAQIVYQGPQIAQVTSVGAGAECTGGGVRIDVGYDDGMGTGTANDGLLGGAEINDTYHVCDGGDGTDGTDGTGGTDGTDGMNGIDGGHGASCTVTEKSDGTATISCPDGSSYTVSDGASGGCSAAGTTGGFTWLPMALVALRLRRRRRGAGVAS
jgi:uncharacterized protein (TIGR03382 family)